MPTPSALLLITIAALGTIAAAQKVPLYHQWIAEERAAPEERVRLTFMLKQRNLDMLEATVNAVSDPFSPRYGDHLTHTQLADLIAPPAAHVDELLSLLRSLGGGEFHVATTGDIAWGHLPAAQAESLFGVELHWHRSVAMPESKRVIRARKCPQTVIPAKLSHVVHSVPDLCFFPMRMKAAIATPDHPAAQAKAAQSPFDPPFTPEQLRQLYNVSVSLVGSDDPNLAQAVMTQQNYCPTDLDSFLSQYAPAAAGQKVAKFVNWTNNDQLCEKEGSVDLEYIIGMAPHVYTYFWGLEDWIDIATAFFTYPNPPKVWSISYHQIDEYAVDRTVYDRMNVEYQKMGAAGGTLVFSSSDNGAGCDPNANSFSVFVPQTSPYVTVVGSTNTQYTGERLTDTNSGGGFSILFPRPAYQNSFVSEYLSGVHGQQMPPASFFNASGRGIPDIAGEGGELVYVRQGSARTISGTSGAAPQLAALFSLLNLERAKLGKPSVGFINPLLYAMKTNNSAVFYDKITGSNRFPYSSQGCNPGTWTTGFYAAPGWNPVTGLGQINFGLASEMSISLPTKFR